jgi:hypothetical protein
LLLIATLLAPAFATSIIPISVDELARRGTVIVEARAIESTAAWNPQHTLISTKTSFQVLKQLKGTPQQTIIVRQLGGHAGGYTQTVAGVSPFFPGQESVLFLRPSDANDGSLEVVGLMQGNFAVAHTAAGDFVTNRASDIKTYDPSGALASENSFSGTTIPLRDFEARIRKAVRP